jgi:hypothetical protein
MSLIKPSVIGPSYSDYQAIPFLERHRRQVLDWAQNGLGAPVLTPLFYVLKIAGWAILGLWLACVTTGVGSMWEFSSWWSEPAVYMKLAIFAMLWEALGLGAGTGPSGFHFLPVFAGFLQWTRPGTIRRPPFRGRLPLAGGDTRSLVDVILYLALLASLVYALFTATVDHAQTTAAIPDSTGGMQVTWVLILPIVLALALGMRDQVVFLAARPEQYLPPMFFALFLGPVDLMIAVKALIVVVWVGSAISKIGEHFALVIGPMMSNSPSLPFPRVRRLFYRKFPDDMRPSALSKFIAHGLGTVVEIGCPIILLLSGNEALAVTAGVLIFGMHVVITSTIPLAVPVEWNIHFLFLIPFLFLGFPAWDGFAVTDASSGWVWLLIGAVLLPLPVLGQFRPDWVSFLPGMRQYAGNWATSMWAFTPQALEKFYKQLPVGSRNQEDVLTSLYGLDASRKLLDKITAFRSLHSQGRGTLSLLLRELGTDIDGYLIRDGETLSAGILGWNFGDAHFHNADFMASVQRRVNFAPGDVVAVFAESQPIHRRNQRYQLVDLALGVIEEGTWDVRDAVSAQPWLSDGPIPVRPDSSYVGRDRYTDWSASAPSNDQRSENSNIHQKD